MTGQSVRGAYSLPPISPNPQEHERDDAHRCGRCYGPYGRSAIPCPNDPNRRTT